MSRRCYECDRGEARYEARLDWTEGLMLLCDECAIWERAVAGVRWIRTLGGVS